MGVVSLRSPFCCAVRLLCLSLASCVCSAADLSAMAGLSTGESTHTSSTVGTALVYCLRCASTFKLYLVPPAHLMLTTIFRAGTIPPYYRELFDVLCPGKETSVDQQVWKACMKTATLPDTVLEQVSELCVRRWPTVDIATIKVVNLCI